MIDLSSTANIVLAGAEALYGLYDSRNAAAAFSLDLHYYKRFKSYFAYSIN